MIVRLEPTQPGLSKRGEKATFVAMWQTPYPNYPSDGGGLNATLRLSC